jgi:hypothetical protein
MPHQVWRGGIGIPANDLNPHRLEADATLNPAVIDHRYSGGTALTYGVGCRGANTERAPQIVSPNARIVARRR